MKHGPAALGLGLGLLIAAAGMASAQWSIDLETGIAWSGYNDVRIPGEGGTKFSLSRDLDARSAAFGRARLGLFIAPRHQLSVLIAPLTLRASGSVPEEIVFYEETFPASAPLDARYTFNSYRLTWRYTLVDSERWRIAGGLTAKVRDAVIRVEGAGRASARTDVGFVPLLSFRVEWLAGPALSVLLEGDALAAPQGRAEDVFLGAVLRVRPGVRLKGGYRLVEGGADNDQVYTFALINYAVVGVLVEF